MSSDRSPIPREALPPGWGPADVSDERIAYRRGRPPIDLVAVRLPASQAHPGLGLCHYWELRYRYAIGERTVRKSIGRVTTRTAALEGLVECMHRIHDRADDLSDPLDVRAALEGVRLADPVPNGPSSP
ncbi:hypothetical protein ACFQGT_13460 [Natrialbaceae archaeon GCM10025810]|uniref:hypothetical protein n=1 Tax=Halovalidus salilacus TaxID=3075124 RepID=UPI00360B7300